MNRPRLLTAAVVAGPLLCLIAALLFPLPNLYKKAAPSNEPLAHLYFDLILLASIAAYGLVVFGWQRGAVPRWLLIAVPVASAIIMLGFSPLNSTDIYDAIFRARIGTVYGGNPLTALPATYETDPFFPAVSWQYTTSPYGPAWELLAKLPAWLGGNDLLLNMVAFKLLGLASWAACAGLVAAIAQQLGADVLRATYLFAACPLALFDVMGNGHNDLTMVAFMLLAVLLLLSGSIALALPALTLAVLVKFIPLLLAPLGLVYAGRRFGWARTWRGVGIGAAISIPLAVVVYLPFWAGMDSVAPLSRSTLFTNSFWAAGVKLANEVGGLPLDVVRNVALPPALLLALGLVVWQTRRLYTSPLPIPGEGSGVRVMDDHFIAACADLLTGFTVLALVWWQPWYSLWIVPFLALHAGKWRLAVLVALNLSAWLHYATNELRKVKVGGDRHENYNGLLVFLPLIALGMWWWVLNRGRRGRTGEDGEGSRVVV